MTQATAIIPIKKDSERVPGKNFRMFNSAPLYTHILDTFQHCSLIDNIIINSDSPELLEQAAAKYSKVIPVTRPEHLYGGHISGNDLIAADIDKVKGEHFLQTHCTNPLLTQRTVEAALAQYFTNLQQYDSLLSVSPIRARLYDKLGKPYNYKAGVMQRIQDMDVVYKENSNFFIFSRQSFKANGNNRVGQKPQVYVMSEIEAMDIDYEDDFTLAELIARNRNLFPAVFKQGKA